MPEGTPPQARGGVGGAVDPQWGCLGDVEWPPLDTPNMEAQLQFFDEDDPTFLLVGAMVKACLRTDYLCTAPADSAVTDDQGRVTLDLTVAPDSEGWTGYFEIAADGYPINLIPTVRPYTNDPHIEFGVVGQTRLDGGAFLLTGSPPDPNRGHLAAIVFDCGTYETRGAALNIDPSSGATLGYLNDDGFPDAALTETNDDGLALAANVEPGPAVEVSATLAATGELIGVTTIPIRAGAITTFGLLPTP